MIQNDKNLAIALAGLFQALALVKRAAAGETTLAAEEATCINSIFNADPASVEDVYGGAEALRCGLNNLIEQLHGKKTGGSMVLTRYAVTILHLERKLANHPDYLESLRQGIQKIDLLSASSDRATPATLIQLAELYTSTISQLTPRIIIQGDPAILSMDEVKAKIRALLLAAIRAAVLWRQCGGTRIKLIFRKKIILHEANRLLTSPTILH